MDAVHHSTNLDWAVSRRSLPGETCSGDEYVLVETPSGMLIAVIDGVGHGPDAAHAAKVALEAVRKNAGLAMPLLVRACHEALRRTRGVVLSLVSIHLPSNTLHWLGVGNVEGVLFPPPQLGKPAYGNIPLRGGVVGSRVPVLKPASQSFSPGDVLVLATDGIHGSFADGISLCGTVAQIAARILQQHAKVNDDALVFVGRFVERGAGV